MTSHPARNFRDGKSGLLIGLVVVAVACLVYANSLGNGFVWDDDVVIVANPALKGSALSLFSGIDVARSTEPTPYYRPLTLLTFLVEERLHGLTPYLVRLANVFLHAANAFLVYRLARRFFKDNYASLLAGLLFAVHPLNSEGVDFNAGGRNTMLACLFILAAYLCHERSARQGKAPGALAGAALFFSGLFAKETTIALLPFIGFIEIPALRKAVPAGRTRAALRLIPYAVGTVIYLILRSNALTGAGVRLEVLAGLGSRLLDNLDIIPRYLLTVVWPASLSPKYFIPDDLHLLALPLTAAWLCILGLLAWLLTRGRSPATHFGLAWLTAFWLPVSGIFPIPSAPLADRYLYIPAIGLWLVIADQATRFQPIREAVRKSIMVIAAVVLVALVAVTVRRNADWRSDVSLFSRVVEQYPERAFGHHNLGCAYLDKEKNLDLAEQEFEKALALDPFFPRLRTQMGYISLQRGDYDGALRHYTDAVMINPGDAEAHLNRAIVLEKLRRYAEAVTEYRLFLATPGNDLAGSRSMAEGKVLGLTRYLGEAGRRERGSIR